MRTRNKPPLGSERAVERRWSGDSGDRVKSAAICAFDCCQPALSLCLLYVVSLLMIDCFDCGAFWCVRHMFA